MNCMSMFLFERFEEFEGVGRRHDVVGGHPPKILTYSGLIVDLLIVCNRCAGY